MEVTAPLSKRDATAVEGVAILNEDPKYNKFTRQIVAKRANPQPVRISKKRFTIISLLQSGRSQSEVARIVGVTRQRVHQIHRGIS